MMVYSRISIDNLIAIVDKGGSVKTGIDVYSAKGVLLLEKDVVVNSITTLELIKAQGVRTLPLNPENHGGIWDEDGNYLDMDGLPSSSSYSPYAGKEKSSQKKGSLKTDASSKRDDISNKQSVKKASLRNENLKNENLRNENLRNESVKKDGLKKDGLQKISKISAPSGEIEKRLIAIEELKIIAAQKYDLAKKSIKKTLNQIRASGGEFDYTGVENHVSELVSFLTISENPFSYLTKEILTYDNFLYSHAVNVCTIGTAVLNRFNLSFSNIVNKHIDTVLPAGDDLPISSAHMLSGSYLCYLKDDILDISIGFFLHDIGKALIPDEVLNKKTKLTLMEFEMIKQHSYGLGVQILEQNRLKNTAVSKIVGLHHSGLFAGEKRCYPENIHSDEIPLSVKICKLADMYDAMTSRTCYREAFNPINVVTDIFRQYARKDKMLQFILHAFVKSIGIYPTGSVIYLKNGQLAYVLESVGPLVIPFTDSQGNTLSTNASPLDLGDDNLHDNLKADSLRSIKTPLEVYDLLPAWLKPRALT